MVRKVRAVLRSMPTNGRCRDKASDVGKSRVWGLRDERAPYRFGTQTTRRLESIM